MREAERKSRQLAKRLRRTMTRARSVAVVLHSPPRARERQVSPATSDRTHT